MAGGIDWFRWHHGSVTDPKFQLVAKRSGVRVADVLAVWAFVLEKASASDERGTFGGLDHEAIDCLFDLEDGKTLEIVRQMEIRGLVEGERICAWDKRQPKRERETDSSTERVREYRQRQKDKEEATSDHVTPCNASETQETPREEKSREDKEENTFVASTLDDTRLPACPHDKIIAAYGDSLPSLPFPRVWEGQRQEWLRARWRWVLTAKRPSQEPYATDAESALDFFKRFFDYVAKCPHLMGENDRGWTADLAWLVKAENFAKVIEGKYEPREVAA